MKYTYEVHKNVQLVILANSVEEAYKIKDKYVVYKKEDIEKIKKQVRDIKIKSEQIKI